MGRKRFRQYSLKRSVRIGRGTIKVVASGSFFSVKIPIAIACISTREKIIELWTKGQCFPAVSYLGSYTLMNCTSSSNNIHSASQFKVLEELGHWLCFIRKPAFQDTIQTQEILEYGNSKRFLIHLSNTS